MKKIFLFFILAFLPLYASKLISYNIYDRNDRVDLMLSFDSAYNGNITQKKEKNLTLITFENLTYDKEELKNLNSKLVDKVQISSKDAKTYIMFQNKEEVELSMSVINDKFGIRLRILPKGSVLETNSNPESTSNNETLPKPKTSSLEGYDYTNYILVMLVLVFLLVVLWWIKRSAGYKNTLAIKEFKIVFQRPLDKNNQFMILDYENKRYVMILGTSNLLLESKEIEQDFSNSHIKKTAKDEKNFDSFFKENQRKIQSILQAKQGKS